MSYPGNKIRKSAIRMVVLIIILITFIPSHTKQNIKTQPVSFPGSCTTLFATIGNTLLFGNNEDYNNPQTYIWVVPSSEDSYGGVYFGYAAGRPQGGINEKGLAFDGLAIPPYPMNDHPELPDVSLYSTHLWREIMGKSATIDEAIDIAMQYNWADPTPHQVLFADRGGNAAVIGPGINGEISVTRKSPGDGFLVATNFNLSDPEVTETDWRYDTAANMLANVQLEDDLTVELFQKILDSVHVEGDVNNTLYSNIFDLNTGTVYLYFWHQFSEVITLDVEEEIAKASPVRQIRDLFSERTITKAQNEYRRYIGDIPYAEEYYLVGWYFITGLLLLYFLRDVFSKKVPETRLNLYWALTLIFSNLIGFAVYWFSYRKPYITRNRNLSQWLRACGAAIFSATGYGASFLIMLLFFHFFFPQGSSGITSLLIPFLINLLLFRAPLLSRLTSGKYFLIVLRSILTELISTIFALSSVILVDSLIKIAYPIAAAPDNVLFYGMISAFTIASFFTIFPFHFWLAHNGYTLWFESIEQTGNLPRSVGKIKVLSFKKGWFFLTISIALLALVIMSV